MEKSELEKLKEAAMVAVQNYHDKYADFIIKNNNGVASLEERQEAASIYYKAYSAMKKAIDAWGTQTIRSSGIKLNPPFEN